MTTRLKEMEMSGDWREVEPVYLAQAKAELKAAEPDLHMRQRWEQMWRAVYHWLITGQGTVVDLVELSDAESVKAIDGFGEKSLERLDRVLAVIWVLAINGLVPVEEGGVEQEN